MPDIDKIQASVNQAIEILIGVKKSISEAQIQMQSTTTSPDDFSQLQELVKSDRWPEAVNQNIICNPRSDKDKAERARGIIGLMIEQDINGTKFLDYGCGEGYCVKTATEHLPSLAVGFDVEPSGNWVTDEKTIFTTNFENVIANGPYDIILVFDVIDHLTKSNPVQVMKNIKSVLADNGKIYLRTHPWTSRHATHLYHSLNKAYLHLVFTEEELKQIVPEAEFSEINYGIKYPVKNYKEIFDAAELNIVSQRNAHETVEPFFRIPKITERIMNNLKMKEFPGFQLSLSFIDYILGK